MNKPTKDLLSQAINSIQEAKKMFEYDNESPPGHAKAVIAQTQALIVIAEQIQKLVLIYEDQQK